MPIDTNYDIINMHVMYTNIIKYQIKYYFIIKEFKLHRETRWDIGLLIYVLKFPLVNCDFDKSNVTVDNFLPKQI